MCYVFLKQSHTLVAPRYYCRAYGFGSCMDLDFRRATTTSTGISDGKRLANLIPANTSLVVIFIASAVESPIDFFGCDCFDAWTLAGAFSCSRIQWRLGAHIGMAVGEESWKKPHHNFRKRRECLKAFTK